ncbi:MAG: HEAT repeat domain-containing protein [Acidobacteria bacterium]|nr:HEAT repeat domain-containing protein [Acidobacteriota bacterium]
MLSQWLSELKSATELEVKLDLIARIGELGELAKPAVQDLLPLLDPANPEIFIATVEALAKIKDPIVLPKLIVLAKDETLENKLRKTAIKFLSIFKDNSIIPDLISLLSDNKVFICNQAVKALAKFKNDSQVFLALTNLLPNTKTLVQNSILKILVKCKISNVVPFFIYTLNNSDEKLFNKLVMLLNNYKYKDLVTNIVQQDPNLINRLFVELEKSFDSFSYYNPIVNLIKRFPEQTLIPRLRNLLYSTKENAQFYGASIAKELKIDELAPALITNLNHPSRYVHSQAAEALASFSSISISEFEKDKFINSLINILENNEWNYAFNQIVENIEDESIKAEFTNKIINLISSSDENIQRGIISILGKLEKFINNAQTIDLLTSMLKDTSKYSIDLRCSIIELLGDLKITEFVPKLIKYLEGSEQIRDSAAYALGQIQDPKTIPYLVKLLNKYKQLKLYKVLEALAKFPDKDALSAVIEQAKNPNIHYVFRLISENPSKEASLAILDALNHPNDEIKEVALNYVPQLNNISKIEIKKILVPLTGHKKLAVRKAASTALSRLDIPIDFNDPDIIFILSAKVKYSYNERDEIVKLITSYKNRIGIILNLIDDFFLEISQAANKYSYEPNILSFVICLLLKKCKGLDKEIAQSNEKSYKAKFIKFLEKKDIDFKVYAINIIAELKDPEFISILRSCLESDHPYTRLAAIKGLTKITDNNLKADLIKFVEQGQDKNVRKVAIAALKSLAWQPN